jgi:uncharacterized MAPEG superfamily protein
MTPELYWLTLTVLMTSLFWLPYILDRLAVRGFGGAVMTTMPETGEPHSLWAKRAIRAHVNAVENLVIFAAAVLVANALKVSTPLTQTAAEVYFFARLVHWVVHVAGIPVIRTLAFAVGWLVQLVFLFSILNWI